jgi:hypothetical protein
MNSKAQQLIDDFAEFVLYYINMEYDITTNIDKYCAEIHRIIASYYLGGNSVGDTAAYVVNYLRSIKHE